MSRLFAGTLRPRQRVARRAEERRRSRPPSRLRAGRSAASRRVVAAGEMATIRGLGAVRVGDAIGQPQPGGRRPRAFRDRPSRPSSSPAKPEVAGLAPGGPCPARRAGPAHRRPPGRPPARDLGLALRRGPEGGHPGDARARLRHRRRLPRDHGRVHRAPRAGRRGRGGHPRQDPYEHHRPELAAEHEPVPGHPGPPDRAGAGRVGDRVPRRRRGSLRPALPVQDGRVVRRPDGCLRP